MLGWGGDFRASGFALCRSVAVVVVVRPRMGVPFASGHCSSHECAVRSAIGAVIISGSARLAGRRRGSGFVSIVQGRVRGAAVPVGVALCSRSWASGLCLGGLACWLLATLGLPILVFDRSRRPVGRRLCAGHAAR